MGTYARLAAIGVVLALACYPSGWRGPARSGSPWSQFPFSVGPYVVYLKPGAAAVVVEHDLQQPPEVQWWAGAGVSPSGEQIHSVTALADEGLWIAELRDLPVDSPVSYRVISEIGQAGPLTFRAGRPRGQPFRFAALGDTRTNHDVHRALIESMALENIDFVINSGDLVSSGGILSQWETFLRIESPVIAQRPLFAAVGNHDVGGPQYFRRYFLTRRYASSNRYYCHDWGDAKVITLDTESELRPRSDQYAFLEACLQDAVNNHQLIFISMHYPPYSSGEHGSFLELREVIGEIAPRFGVEVVLAGHDHDYERTKVIDGVTYIVAASGGAPIRKVSPSDFTENIRTEPHYVLFDVEGDRITGRAVNLHGNVFDNFLIKDSLAGPPLP